VEEKMITVFETYEEACEPLARLLGENNTVRGEYEDRVQKEEQDYRERTGWNERIRKKIEADERAIFKDPSMYGLSSKEREKFWAQIGDVGEGLELTCAIHLMAEGDSYHFMGGTIRPDDPSGPQNQPSEYNSIRELVAGVKEYLVQERTVMGVEIDPFFYTVRENLRLSEDEKDGLNHSLAELYSEEFLEQEKEGLDDEEIEEFEGMVGMMKKFCSGLLEEDPVTRGLNEEERKEFEKIW
jgi:hypothetical protein